MNTGMIIQKEIKRRRRNRVLTNLFIIILAITLFVGMAYSSHTLYKIYKAETSIMSQDLGKQILIGNEWHTIINYSYIKGEYYLDSGITISKDYVEQQIK